MKKWFMTAALAALVAAVWLTAARRDGSPDSPARTEAAPAPDGQASGTDAAEERFVEMSNPEPPPAAAAHPLAAAIGGGSLSPADEPAAIREMLEAYLRLNGELPSAEDNASLMRRLRAPNGSVPPLFPQRHERYGEDGALLDAWGTPFFFHHLSSRDIEIRSAGPDRELYTGDDITAATGR